MSGGPMVQNLQRSNSAVRKSSSSLPSLKKASTLKTPPIQSPAGSDAGKEKRKDKELDSTARSGKDQLSTTGPIPVAAAVAAAHWARGKGALVGGGSDAPSPRLTVATLKHVKVQLEALKDEHAKVLEQNKALTEKTVEQEEEIERLRALLAERGEAPSPERVEGLEAQTAKLEGALAAAEAELARVREEQERTTEDSGELERLRADVVRLRKEGAETARQRDRAIEMLQDTRVELKGALESVSKLAGVAQRLREGALADAIRRKVTMHYLGPRATLMGAEGKQVLFAPDPPTKEAITRFVKHDVVPRFKAMFTTLDGMDEAPDGSSLRQYADGVVEYLATGVKKFIDENSSQDRA